MLLCFIQLAFSINLDDGLVCHYKFQNNLADSLGNCLNLETVDSPSYSYNQNGLSWTSGNARGSGFLLKGPSNYPYILKKYSIGMRIKYPSATGYRKIVDFKSRSTDHGLYYYSDDIRFYPYASYITVPKNTFIEVIFSCDTTIQKNSIFIIQNGLVVGVANNTDTSIYCKPNDSGGRPLYNLLVDDQATSSEATKSGEISYIKIWLNSFIGESLQLTPMRTPLETPKATYKKTNNKSINQKHKVFVLLYLSFYL